MPLTQRLGQLEALASALPLVARPKTLDAAASAVDTFPKPWRRELHPFATTTAFRLPCLLLVVSAESSIQRQPL
jgi:hypothetical protein